jgi:hypothetical protein
MLSAPGVTEIADGTDTEVLLEPWLGRGLQLGHPTVRVWEPGA